MDINSIEFRLLRLGDAQISIRRQIGILEDQLKILRKELRENEKEVSKLRSTKEYEELVKER